MAVAEPPAELRLAALRTYLCALSPVPATLALDAERPFIAGSAIHLPAQRPGVAPAGAAIDSTDDDWPWQCAAAAHAMAHLVYSPPVFDGRGLGPLVRALMCVLEDARVEVLMAARLPGLRRLWASLHTVGPNDGANAPTLMLRLARALADPAYTDPHAWVGKARALFFSDELGTVPSVTGAADLRRLATRLGNDLGQMRLRFNAPSWRPGPDYRDDARWMWPAGATDEGEPVTPPSEAPARAARQSDAPPVPDAPSSLHRYPEWDARIARLRSDWCTVTEVTQPVLEWSDIDQPMGADPGLARVLRRNRRSGPRADRVPSHRGERFDPQALVRAAVAIRMGEAIDARLYLEPRPPRDALKVFLVIDQSASCAQPLPGSSRSVMAVSCDVAVQLAQAWQDCGVPAAVAGFSSEGRHAISLRSCKDFEEPVGVALRARLGSLRPQHSTRLGAAIRHASFRLAQQRGTGDRLLVVLGDGQPWDIDIHEPDYLVADARQAVMQARRDGVRTACIVLDPDAMEAASRVFGWRATVGFRGMGALDALARRLV
jgi:nitric oxide reductase NorD protein